MTDGGIMATEMVTFEVSDVPVERSELKRGSVAQVLGAHFSGRIERAIELDRGFAPTEEHPFLGAARHAFARHLPLRLRPDDVWLLLVQGFAQHVSIHAEELRGRLVSHAGKLTITVVRDEFVRGAPDNDWASVFPEFRERIREHVGVRHDLIVGDFSTTSPTDRVVGSIALMDVMQHYFDFVVLTRCGIPRITLTGTPDDWRQIRERARVFAEFDLEWWCEPLEDALTHFVDAAEGRADRDVWQSFYKWNNGSGGPFVSGWVNALFPYILQRGPRKGADVDVAHGVRNPYAIEWARGGWGGGPNSAELPGGLRSVPFIWDYLGTKIPMQFVGGFIGARQDPDGTVAPQVGWAVLDCPSRSLDSPK